MEGSVINREKTPLEDFHWLWLFRSSWKIWRLKNVNVEFWGWFCGGNQIEARSGLWLPNADLSLCLSHQVSGGQSSLLGDPPKEVRLPSNPYLNLASVMPGVVLQGRRSHSDRLLRSEWIHLAKSLHLPRFIGKVNKVSKNVGNNTEECIVFVASE